MYQVEVMVEGVAEALQDRYPLPVPGEAKKHKGKNDAEKELRDKAYVDDRGIYIPADSIRMSLIGNRFRTGAAKILGSTIETAKGTRYLDFCKACVWVLGIEDPLKVYYEPLRPTWDDVYVTPFINAAGSKSVSKRPLIKMPWSLRFIVQVTDDTFTPAKIREFFEVSGLRCGLGAYGPRFGRFVIKEWKVLD